MWRFDIHRYYKMMTSFIFILMLEPTIGKIFVFVLKYLFGTFSYIANLGIIHGIMLCVTFIYRKKLSPWSYRTIPLLCQVMCVFSRRKKETDSAHSCLNIAAMHACKRQSAAGPECLAVQLGHENFLCLLKISHNSKSIHICGAMWRIWMNMNVIFLKWTFTCKSIWWNILNACI